MFKDTKIYMFYLLSGIEKQRKINRLKKKYYAILRIFQLTCFSRKYLYQGLLLEYYVYIIGTSNCHQNMTNNYKKFVTAMPTLLEIYI